MSELTKQNEAIFRMKQKKAQALKKEKEKFLKILEAKTEAKLAAAKDLVERNEILK